MKGTRAIGLFFCAYIEGGTFVKSGFKSALPFWILLGVAFMCDRFRTLSLILFFLLMEVFNVLSCAIILSISSNSVIILRLKKQPPIRRLPGSKKINTQMETVQ